MLHHKPQTSTPNFPLLIPHQSKDPKSAMGSNSTNFQSQQHTKSILTTLNNQQINDNKIDDLIQQEINNSLMQSAVNIFQEKSFHSKKSIKNKMQEQRNQIKSFIKGKKNGKFASVEQLKGVVIGPQEILFDRFKKSKEEVQNKISGLQKSCDKFGGSQYIKNQMNKHQISTQQLFDFYRQRIKSIHGSLSLPRINPRNLGSQSHTHLNPNSQNHNKWYIAPEKRFTSNIQNQQQNRQIRQQKSVTKYVQKMFLNNNKDKKVSIKYQYAPIIVKQSIKKLGREPIVCSYAQIKRR